VQRLRHDGGALKLGDRVKVRDHATACRGMTGRIEATDRPCPGWYEVVVDAPIVRKNWFFQENELEPVP